MPSGYWLRSRSVTRPLPRKKTARRSCGPWVAAETHLQSGETLIGAAVWHADANQAAIGLLRARPSFAFQRRVQFACDPWSNNPKSGKEARRRQGGALQEASGAGTSA